MRITSAGSSRTTSACGSSARRTCRIWAYRDPSGRIAGFGTLDVCEDYADFTVGRPHPYIPLLAVNSSMRGLGYGRWIVRHLIAEAAILANGPGTCHDVLFLDVYADNLIAISLCEKCGFLKANWPEPRPHLEEADRPYIIMEMRVSFAPP